MRLNVPTPYLPYAEGGFPTPSGKCEFVLAAAGRAGTRSAADVHPAVRVGRSATPALVARYPLTLISSPAHTLPQHDVREHHVAPPEGARAGSAAAPGRRGATRDRAGHARDGAQRPRRIHRDGARGDRRSARASCGRRRSGGASSRQTTRTPIRPRRSGRRTWGTVRCSTTTRWKSRRRSRCALRGPACVPRPSLRSECVARSGASIPFVVATGLHAASLAKLPRVSCYARSSSSGNALALGDSRLFRTPSARLAAPRAGGGYAASSRCAPGPRGAVGPCARSTPRLVAIRRRESRGARSGAHVAACPCGKLGGSARVWRRPHGGVARDSRQFREARSV